MYTDADSHGDTYIRDKEFAKSLWNSRIQRNPMIFNENQSKSICWNEFNPMGCLSFHLLFLASLCVFVIIRVFICINMCICVCIYVYLYLQHVLVDQEWGSLSQQGFTCAAAAACKLPPPHLLVTLRSLTLWILEIQIQIQIQIQMKIQIAKIHQLASSSTHQAFHWIMFLTKYYLITGKFSSLGNV